jgi:hypothetical protein
LPDGSATKAWYPKHEARNVVDLANLDTVFANRGDCLCEVFNSDGEVRRDDFVPFEQVNLGITELQP